MNLNRPQGNLGALHRETAAETISAMLAVFGRIDPHLRSITFDNDTAFAEHALRAASGFFDAYA
jgi:hypothetical protein